MQLDEEVREFLIESNENLVNLDQEIVLLEQQPKDAVLIASVFRTIHTIKGTCGFFGFDVLGAVAHLAESLLGQVRDGRRELTPDLTVLVLESVDAVKTILAAIEADGSEGPDHYEDLRERLTAAIDRGVESSAESRVKEAPPAAVVPEVAVVAEAKKPVQEDKPVAAVVPGPVASGPVVRSAVSPGPVVPGPVSPGATPEVSTNELDGKTSVLGDSTIRVDVGLLDKLMNLVGELVLARNQLLQGAAGQDLALVRTVQRLNVITSELQEGVLKTRMQPIGVVWNKLPRVIRDLAAECGKKIHLSMEGAETELDKTIIEAIKDPLTHIVRNSCDHGIEDPEQRVRLGKPVEGRVMLRAYHEGGHVQIEISDDGRGLDVEKLKARAMERGVIRADQAATMTDHEAVHLVFKPGFSTAEKVTKLSGRGVGMDVVKTNIEKIGGIVDIFNRKGMPGSTVKIKIPLTLAIIPGLVITAERGGGLPDHRFVIPQANLLELVRLEREGDRRQIEYVNGTPVYRRRDQLLALTYLNRVLGMSEKVFPDSPVVNIVVLQAEDRPFGLVVDGICDTQEIVVKPLGKRLKGLSSYLGATIMGDGRVALILDIPGLARLAGMVAQSRDPHRLETFAPPGRKDARQSYLIFSAGSFKRLAVPLALVGRLEQFPQSSVQMASGKSALHYRDQILPLVHLAALLGSAANDVSHPEMNVKMLQVIVLGEGAQRMGVVVDQIVDIVKETITFQQSSSHSGLLGSAILGDHITDFLDLQGVLDGFGETALQSAGEREVQVLLLEPSPLRRTMLRNYLEMRGYTVREAATVDAALAAMAGAETNVILAATASGSELMAAMEQQGLPCTLPVIALAGADARGSDLHPPPGFAGSVNYHEREELLRLMKMHATASLAVAQ